nr:pentatricopeptide repeat protein AaPPR488 [Agave angustifolia]UPT49615.1 pentatricopeptide repeat protein AaPPR965 [Agave angustifolia]
MMKEMQVKGASPDVITYNNLIYCLCEKGMMKQAASLLDEMMQSGVVPNITSYRLLIEALCKAREFDAVQTTFQVALTTCGEKEVLYRLMCNELCTYGKVFEAKEILQIALEKGFSVENFTYQYLIEQLCKGGKVDDAHNLLLSMINKGYQFDPATFMPLIDALVNMGDKHEANKLSEQMMNMAAHQDKSFEGFSYPHPNEMKHESNKLKQDSSLGNDWRSLLHRDDGSGIALKVLKRVQKGWGQGSIPVPRTKDIEFLDD